MNQEFELLQFIREQPDDLSRRLVYADWLEEFGETQAEYIRVQCKLFRERKTLWGTSLRMRAAALWRVGKSRWDARLWRILEDSSLRGSRPGTKLRSWGYHRGCVETIAMSAESVADHLEAALMIGPVTHLKLCRKGSCSNRSKLRLIDAFEKTDPLRGIWHLDLADLNRGKKKLMGLLQLETLRNLRSIRFSSKSFPSSSTDYRSNRDPALERVAQQVFESSFLERVEFQMVGRIAVFERPNFEPKSVPSILRDDDEIRRK